MTTEQKLQDRLRHWAGIEAATFPTSGLIVCLNEAINRINETERQLAEAQKDQARLDFVLDNDAFKYQLGPIKIKWQLATQDEDEEYIILSGEGKSFDTPRQAIDAAMKGK